MSLQTVSDLSDAVVLESNLGLYLKPVSRIKINVQLPKLNIPGQSISTWHVMEKLKATVRPDTFLYLKSLKITSAVIKFEGELETKASCERALARLRAAGSLKISGFSEKLQVRAAHATAAGPTRHDWEAFFRDAKGVNEMKPGERPDTIHLQELPIRYFSESSKGHNPNEKLLRLAFGTFGKIRRLEVPVRADSDNVNTIGKTGPLHKDSLFEVYVQYEEYVEFAIAMDSLRGKKLLYKDPSGKVYSADIKVDFDRTKYLSEACIRKREAEERKLNPNLSVKKEKEITKDISFSTSQAKENLQAPVRHVIPPEQTKPTSQAISAKDSKTKVKIVDQVSEDKKKAQLEAKFLLRELLLKAEKTERHKEEAKQVEVNHKELESRKRLKESASNEVHPKKIKTTKEKNYNELGSRKMKHSEEKPAQVKRDRKEQKVEKRTHSEERKTAKPSSKTEEKRIKVEVEYKEDNSKLNSKNKERTSKSIEGRYKETKVVTHCDKANKEKTSRHTTEIKNKEGEKSFQLDKANRDYKSASKEKKNKDKGTFLDCDKTHKDYNNHEKMHKEKGTLVHCDKTNDCHKISKQGKFKDSKLHGGNEDKAINVEVSLENETKDEQIRMYVAEKKLKERLIQSYNQNKRNKAKLLEQERILKEKLLRNLRVREEEKLKEREKLRKELSGRKVLKSVLADARLFSKKH